MSYDPLTNGSVDGVNGVDGIEGVGGSVGDDNVDGDKEVDKFREGVVAGKANLFGRVRFNDLTLFGNNKEETQIAVKKVLRMMVMEV